MNSHWSGITDPEKLHSGFVDLVDQLADQSRDGNWDAILQLLGTHANLSPNQWRIGGTSWFTPLHQTAWLGAPVEVVDELINQAPGAHSEMPTVTVQLISHEAVAIPTCSMHFTCVTSMNQNAKNSKLGINISPIS